MFGAVAVLEADGAVGVGDDVANQLVRAVGGRIPNSDACSYLGIVAFHYR